MKTKTKQLVVKVCQGDINSGVPENATSCPIARALRSIVKDVNGYEVLQDQIQIRGKIMALPKSARKFIKKFDAGDPVKPFNFRVKLPVSSLK
jgi:hypothetical protein